MSESGRPAFEVYGPKLVGGSGPAGFGHLCKKQLSWLAVRQPN